MGAVSCGEAWEGHRAPGAQGWWPRSGLSELLIQAVLPFPVVWKDFSSLGTWPHTRAHVWVREGRGPQGAQRPTHVSAPLPPLLMPGKTQTP